MLNFDVKQKINTLRDILVGKVPDPKAQVEQITIALIYKFMDDIDLQSVDFGGAREFFKEEYIKYAFSQIMLPGHGAQDRLILYAEGIEKMSNNADLPKLFRDILHNAYIPYRDPETLNLFLKTIAEFSYEDSEDLGNAFEYLLSIMGSQGDAGQFRTPRHIIDMMVEITAPRKDETILDPACGTAGFLISAYKYIQKENLDEQGRSKLTADDKTRMTKNFAGYDISPDMVRLSRVNMYLHGFMAPNISEYDTLTSLDKWNDKYDVILANPPFMTPKGGITPHNRYQVQAKRAEVLFVDYILEHLNPQGRAAIIVPEGIVFQSQTAYKNLRKMLVDGGYLYGVISLPAGVFNPYSGVKTSILMIDRTLAKNKDSILFVKLNNDGFDLGAQRREIKGSEIPDVINIFKDYQKGINVEGRENVLLAKKTDIAKQDWILVGERYKEVSVHATVYPIVTLGEVCEVIAGQSPDGQFYNDSREGLPFYQGKTEFTSKYLGEPKKWTTQVTKTAAKNDIVMSVRAPVGPVNIVLDNICIGRGLAAIRCGQRISHEYLFYVLQSIEESIKGNTGAAFASINRKEIETIQIPLPPLTVQEEIVAEIERYQKIIDGARQVVENYKPTIKIDPKWERKRLSSVCDVRDGTHDSPQFYNEGIPLITSKNIRNNTISFDDVSLISRDDYDKINLRSKVDVGDILMPMIGTIGRPVIVSVEREFAIKNVALIKCTETPINKFVLLMLQSREFEKYIVDHKRGGTQNFLSLSDIRSFCIPVPSLDEQQKVICEIEAEASIVKQNKHLIEIFQQKIKDKIAEVWGE